MHEYEVELIHESSGASMHMIVFTEDAVDEDELAREIWADMSVVVFGHIAPEDEVEE